MRGQDTRQAAMFSYVSLEERIPADHPLRAIGAVTERAEDRDASQQSPSVPGLFATTAGARGRE